MNSETAKQVEAETGINLGDFMRDVAEMSPIGNHGRCIFCDGDEKRHGAACKWVQLRASMGYVEASR